MRRLALLVALITLVACTRSDTDEHATLVGEWRAIAIHLPEPYTSTDGDDRLDISDYGSARLQFKEDSTYESNVHLMKDLRIKRPVGPSDVTTTLWQGSFTSQRFGEFTDSAGYLILTNQDFISSSYHELRHGVLTTTTTVKGHTFQIIWEREN